MTLEKLLINDRTKKLVGDYTDNPSHGLLLVGAAGSGKQTLAEAIGAKILGLLDSQSLEAYAYFELIERQAGKQDISIDAVRKVIRESSIVVPGNKAVKRLIIFSGAEALSLPAQNAILKLLEEPPAGTVLILTATSAKSLLPTITSRLNVIDVAAVDLSSVETYYANEYSKSELEAAWRLSGGRVGLLQSLLSEADDHPLKQAIESAKQLVSARDSFEKGKILESVSSDKEQLKSLLEALDLILSALSRSATEKSDDRQLTQILKRRKLVQRHQKALSDNGNVRLISLALTLNI